MICVWYTAGVGGGDGDGDIYRPDNLTAFRDYIQQSTDGQGLHFMMADGVSHHSVFEVQNTNVFGFKCFCKAFAKLSNHF